MDEGLNADTGLDTLPNQRGEPACKPKMRQPSLPRPIGSPAVMSRLGQMRGPPKGGWRHGRRGSRGEEGKSKKSEICQSQSDYINIPHLGRLPFWRNLFSKFMCTTMLHLPPPPHNKIFMMGNFCPPFLGFDFCRMETLPTWNYIPSRPWKLLPLWRN